MPYVLKDYPTGTPLTETEFPPQAAGSHDKFAHAGWTPAAIALGLQINNAYQIEGPKPGDDTCRIKLKSVGAGLNAITYVKER